jgi:hypothetical protein
LVDFRRTPTSLPPTVSAPEAETAVPSGSVPVTVAFAEVSASTVEVTVTGIGTLTEKVEPSERVPVRVPVRVMGTVVEAMVTETDRDCTVMLVDPAARTGVRV